MPGRITRGPNLVFCWTAARFAAAAAPFKKQGATIWDFLFLDWGEAFEEAFVQRSLGVVMKETSNHLFERGRE